MAYVPMDISALQRVQAPRADVLGSLLGGQKAAAQQQALAGITDPMERYKMLFGGVPKIGAGLTANFQAKQDMMNKASEIKSEINQLASEAIKEYKANGESDTLISLANQIDAKKGILTQYSDKRYIDPFEEFIDVNLKGRRIGLAESDSDFKEEKELTGITKDAVQRTQDRYKTRLNAFAKGSKVLNQVGAAFAEAVKNGNAQAMQGAVKMMVSSLDDSVVTAGEMSNLASPGILNRIQTWITQQGDNLFYSAEDVQNFVDMYKVASDQFNKDVADITKAMVSSIDSEYNLVSNRLLQRITPEQRDAGKQVLKGYGDQYLTKDIPIGQAGKIEAGTQAGQSSGKTGTANRSSVTLGKKIRG